MTSTLQSPSATTPPRTWSAEDKVLLGLPVCSGTIRIARHSWSAPEDVARALGCLDAGEGRTTLVEAAWTLLLAWYADWPDEINFTVVREGVFRVERIVVKPDIESAHWLESFFPQKKLDSPVENAGGVIQTHGAPRGNEGPEDIVLVLDDTPFDQAPLLRNGRTLLRIDPEKLTWISSKRGLLEDLRPFLYTNFEAIIRGLREAPRQRVLDLATPNASECLVLRELASVGPQLEAIPFCSRLREAALAFPTNLAVVDGDRTLSYAELLAKSNLLAMRLAQRGAKLGDRIAILAPRSTELILCMVATQMIGASYLVLDPQAPAAWLTDMVSITKPALILRHLASTENEAALPMAVVEVRDLLVKYNDDAPCVPEMQLCRDADAEAYVIFTSGTTGRPKGISISNRALWTFYEAAIGYLNLGTNDKMLQFALPSFDAIVEEVFPTLAVGATLVIRREEVVGSAAGFFDWVQNSGITVLDLPTGYWRELIASALIAGAAFPRSVRLTLVGGEALLAPDIQNWVRLTHGTAKILNTYGPTEATVVSTTWAVPTEPGEEVHRVPIGRPIPGRIIYITDRFGRPAPVGAEGEISIAGACIASGYLNDARSTSEKFVRATWAPPEAQRQYRTGDRGRIRPRGDIDFLGRLDNQVKLKGYRVELDEVAATIRALPGVIDAAVIIWVSSAGQKRMTAFAVEDGHSRRSGEELMSAARERLPRYMLPSQIYQIGAIPLTGSGKTDVTLLRGLAQKQFTDREAGRPLDVALQAIWSEALGVGTVSDETDFFDQGGDSLASVVVLMLVEKRLFVTLPPDQLHVTSRFGEFKEVVRSAGNGTHQMRCVTPASARLGVSDFMTWRDGEASLPPDFRALEKRAAPVGGVSENILLTGATGFLGAALLEELVVRDDVQQVTCFIRPSKFDEFQRRVANVSDSLPQLGIKVRAIAASLDEPQFGLRTSEWLTLAESVDRIFHCAASTSILLPYDVLRAANVGGTKELLTLANTVKSKQLNHMSTLAILSPLAARGEVPQTIDLAQVPHLNTGYAQSKWVADRLVLQAQNVGADCHVFRCGRMWGEAGLLGAEPNDLITLMLTCCVVGGAFPDIDFDLDVAPVTFFRKAICRIAYSQSTGGVFHLCNPERTPFRSLHRRLERAGFPLRVMSYQDWRREMLSLTGDAVRLASRTLVRKMSAVTFCLARSEGLDWDDVYVESPAMTAHLRALSLECPRFPEDDLVAAVRSALAAGDGDLPV